MILIFLLLLYSLLYLWINIEITLLHFLLAGHVLLDILGKMFISPIVVKGPESASLMQSERIEDGVWTTVGYP